jgi:hypothetical protein
MSGLVKKVKKVVKKAAKFVKKNWKVIAMAVAIYFTAGVAMSYFPSTAGFSAAMPGFGAGEIFAKSAVWMGFGGVEGSGIYSTAAAKALAAGSSAGGAGALSEVGVTGVKKAGTHKLLADGTYQAVAGGVQAGAATTAAETGLTATDALIKSLNTQAKMGYIQMGLNTVSGLLSPSADELDESGHARRNASAFGVGRDGDRTHGFSQNPTTAFQNMNKTAGESSSFTNSEFVPTDFEQNNPNGQMSGQPSQGQDFISKGYNNQQGGYG